MLLRDLDLLGIIFVGGVKIATGSAVCISRQLSLCIELLYKRNIKLAIMLLV